MQYIILPHHKAEQIGISLEGHQVTSSEVLINEMEVMRNRNLNGSFLERVAELKTAAFSQDQAALYVTKHKFHLYAANS